MDDIRLYKRRLKDAKRNQQIEEKQALKMAARLKRNPETMRQLSAEDFRANGFLGGTEIKKDDLKGIKTQWDLAKDVANETEILEISEAPVEKEKIVEEEYISKPEVISEAVYEENAEMPLEAAESPQEPEKTIKTSIWTPEVVETPECQNTESETVPEVKEELLPVIPDVFIPVEESMDTVCVEEVSCLLEDKEPIIPIVEEAEEAQPEIIEAPETEEIVMTEAEVLEEEIAEERQEAFQTIISPSEEEKEPECQNTESEMVSDAVEEPKIEENIVDKNELPIEETKMPTVAVTEKELRRAARKARREKQHTRRIVTEKTVTKKRTPGEKKKEKETPEIDFRNVDDEVLLVPPLPYTNVSDYIPVKSIKRGIIETTDGTYVKILEILPVNFHLRTTNEQNKIIRNYIAFQKVSPVRYQIKTVALKADIDRFLVASRIKRSQEKIDSCKALQEEKENSIIDLGARTAVARRFFLIISVPGRKNADEQEIRSMLQTAAFDIETYLSSCGNVVKGVSYGNNQVLELLYMLFNRSDRPAQDLQIRLNDVKDYYLKNYGEKSLSLIPITEAFAPMSLDFKDHRYVVVNNEWYVSYLYITSKGYPEQTFGGWIDRITSATEGNASEVDIFYQKEDREKTDTRIGRHMRWHIASLKETNATTKEYGRLSEYLQAGIAIKNGLAQGEELYNCCIVLTIKGRSEKEVLQKIRAEIKRLMFYNIQAEKLSFKIRLGYQAAMPFMLLPKQIYQKAHRNMLTSNVGTMYPFTAYEMNDHNGVFLGLNTLNSSLTVMDFYNTTEFPNANMVILGRTGMGKSYLLQLLALQTRYQQKQVFIIAPEKGFEFERSCAAVGGTFLSMSPSSGVCINPLEIHPKDERVNEGTDGTTIIHSQLIEKVEWLQMLLGVWIKDITGEEENLLNTALMETYRRKGITKDNDSLWNESRTGYKEMPVFSDLYEVLQEKPETRRIATYMLRLIEGSASNFNKPTTVDLNNLYVVFDLSSLKGDILRFAMLIALDLVYSKIKEDRTKEDAVFIDEIWRLIGLGADPMVANYVLELFKLIRSYGGSALGATQDIADFLGTSVDSAGRISYGELIINACATKFVLGLEPREAKRVKDILDLSEDETQKVISFKRGNGLVCTLNSRIPVNFKASPKENELITTDHREIAEIKSRGRIG